MMHPPARAGTADLLTRTMLQMDENVSPGAIGHMITALQRVPGVLLAEIAPGARTIVAHDAAVPSASLLEAAARTGVRLKLVADTRAPAATVNILTQPLAGMPIRRLLMLAAALFFLPFFIAAISPGLANNHFVLPILLSSVWAFVIARSMFNRRP